MKRRMLIIAIAVIVLSAAAAGTLAYFTARGEVANTITAGNISMKLHDETASGGLFSENSLIGLMPGESADRIVYVENTGDNPFYTRIKLNNAAFSNGRTDTQLSSDKFEVNIDTAHWQLSPDGWYYYLSAVDKGGKSAPLFTRLTFKPNTGNDYMNATVRIEVISQAVQTDNNGGTVWQAAGWPSK